MSDWDDKAEDHAVAHHTYEHMSPEVNAKIYMGFVLGARWQRDQLRTDEAVERVAEKLYQGEYQHPMAEHDTWCQVEDCTNAEDYRDQARIVITALLGEGS